MITIYARRNSDLTRVGIIDEYASLKLNLKFNEPSKWELVADTDSPFVPSLDASMGIVVERDGTVILSGPVEETEEQWDTNGHVMTVFGSDDSIWLSRRIVFPSAWPFTGAAYDTNTATASTNLFYYVNKNAGPSADADRQVPGLVMGTDNSLGSSVRGRGRLQPLNDLLKQLALSGGDLRYQIVQVGSTLEFQVYDPEDLTASVQFSKAFGNLSSFTYERVGPSVNYVYIGGGGTGTGRTFRRGNDSPSVAEWGLIEDFRDARDTTDNTELDERITETLAEGSETTSLGITPIDTAAVTYGTDYNLGDRVRVVTPSNVIIEDAIRELTLTYKPGGGEGAGEVIEPVVGTPGATRPRVPKIFKKRKYHEKRTKNLERV